MIGNTTTFGLTVREAARPPEDRQVGAPCSAGGKHGRFAAITTNA